jgi:RNA-directed DNA polymerase
LPVRSPRPATANRAGHPNFRAHLLGRIAWVEQLNPARGARLRERFEAVAWAAP